MSGAKTRNKRKIIKIDEEKCNGCGLCVLSCAEGALQIVSGKARLVSENYCDGLGACIGECPQGALIIEEREAGGFDEEAVEHYLSQKQDEGENMHFSCPGQAVRLLGDEKESGDVLACGCPSRTVTRFEAGQGEISEAEQHESLLTHWPVQLRLVPPSAPFLKNADLMLVADCVPFAYADLHRDIISGHAVLVACPKLDDYEEHLSRLTQIVKEAGLKSITAVHMEVPCCSGLVNLARQAIEKSGQRVPLNEMIISVRGKHI